MTAPLFSDQQIYLLNKPTCTTQHRIAWTYIATIPLTGGGGGGFYVCETFSASNIFHCEKRLTASSCLSVRLSAWNSAPTGRNFMKNWNLSIFFFKSVKRIQLSLQSGKNKGYFTWRPIYIFHHISLNSSSNEKNISDNSYIENRNTRCYVQ